MLGRICEHISDRYKVCGTLWDNRTCGSVAGTSTRLNNCEGSDVKTKHLSWEMVARNPSGIPAPAHPIFPQQPRLVFPYIGAYSIPICKTARGRGRGYISGCVWVK